MKLEIETNYLPPSQLVKIAEALAADAVRKIGDILQQAAEAHGEAPLPMGIFAVALLNANCGAGPLDMNHATTAWSKGVVALQFLAKEFA